MELLEAGETMRRLEAAVIEARAFFGIDPLWETPVIANLPDGAQINADPAYLRGPIRVELHYFQEHPDRIREFMAHEVAHILSAELNEVRGVLPSEWADAGTPQGRMFHAALEKLTVRLERLFMRERPCIDGSLKDPVTLAALLR